MAKEKSKPVVYEAEKSDFAKFTCNEERNEAAKAAPIKAPIEEPKKKV